MNALFASPFSVWAIAFAATFGVVMRPFRLPEAIWALLGALTLCLSGALPWADALRAAGKGTDVYLFLTGMMIVAELAGREGLFDYMAALAARRAAGSAKRLFFLLYGVGTVVTITMSNDATAVVLTPAVVAVARAVKAEKPLPLLYICAFVANAASFVLPISNPANLVVFHDRLPGLAAWLARFAAPSALSVVVTYVALRFAQRGALCGRIERNVDVPPLGASGKTTGCGIVMMAAVMMASSARGVSLGLPTFAAGAAVFVAVCLQKRRLLWSHLAQMSWSVLPLVAGLFVIVEGLDRTGAIRMLAHLLDALTRYSVTLTVWLSGVAIALVCSLVNNLPAGLLAGTAIAATKAPATVAGAVLVGVDLGPNLSITGSLATILWLAALRKGGLEVRGVDFLKVGAVVMLPALVAALLGLSLSFS
ncbi:arsenite efflux membrane protein ArsB [Trinickia symbiotica]|uniref:Arsenic transporter n=1 Tax=Trinickia symbiotica TaxID=863227 RepID=A0A2N7X7L5_9BURK|nr:SLC13 family permease [Trinickia symbiotica]PMS37758.1 arsenic transporter [Trinickia symbiotica]PPK44305.1 arsenite efflux membrane protein ArsB [Trinickia symbiotica]